MSSFTTPLEGFFLDDNVHFVLSKPFQYHRTGFRNVIYTVPRGFVTDFASIPKMFRWLISKYGRYDKASVLHDYLYFEGRVNRKWADRIFLEAMVVLNVTWWKRNAMYRAVSIGGWIAWNNHRKNDKKRTKV